MASKDEDDFVVLLEDKSPHDYKMERFALFLERFIRDDVTWSKEVFRKVAPIIDYDTIGYLLMLYRSLRKISDVEV